jgi:uncharacterized protein (DUF2236 family)
VLFGGARAVLMQAAHPLVIAGARETGFYERNPWRRLQRTLALTYTLTFGTRSEAQAAAERINDVHARVHGVDSVTGLPYDALDPQLLLFVHACLVESALIFERLTVGRLGERGRQRFHEEQMLAAEMMRVPRDLIPPTVRELSAYLREVEFSGILRATDATAKVASLFRDPPKEAEWRPVLGVVARLAFGSLPSPYRALYGVDLTPRRRVSMRATFAALRGARSLLPPRYRFIAPYQERWLVQRGAGNRNAFEASGRASRLALDDPMSLHG